MSGLTVCSMGLLKYWIGYPTVYHYSEESVRLAGGYWWRVSEPLIKVGPSGKKIRYVSIRRTDDHKNKFNQLAVATKLHEGLTENKELKKTED